MPDDIPYEEINEIKRMMEGYIDNFVEVDSNVSQLVKNSTTKIHQLESLDENTQKMVLENYRYQITK